ncbi:MAG: hypothetical protein WC784_03505 [Candidatus Shapirobacteria bacterium]|jgi:hypothetical protein
MEIPTIIDPKTFSALELNKPYVIACQHKTPAIIIPQKIKPTNYYNIFSIKTEVACPQLNNTDQTCGILKRRCSLLIESEHFT